MTRAIQVMVFTVLMLALTAVPVVAFANEIITVTIDGQAVVFEDQGPVIVDGRTLVPVGGVFGALGFTPVWDGPAQTATLTRDDYTIVITIGSAVFTTNGIQYTLDVSAQIINGRTMLPIRAVLESVGYELDWDSATRTVVITSPEEDSPEIVLEPVVVPSQVAPMSQIRQRLGVEYTIQPQEYVLGQGNNMLRWQFLELEEPLDLELFQANFHFESAVNFQIGSVYIMTFPAGFSNVHIHVGPGPYDIYWFSATDTVLEPLETIDLTEPPHPTINPFIPTAIEHHFVSASRNNPFLADAIYFVETIEITHPIFGFPEMLDETVYLAMRTEFLETVRNVTNNIEFNFAIQRFITVLRDGHMSGDGRWLFGNSFVSIHWTFRDDGLYLEDGSRVIEIAGIPVLQILDVIDRYFYFENEADRRFNYEVMSRNKEVHARAGAMIGNDISVTTSGRSIQLNYREGAWVEGMSRPRPNNYVIRHEVMNDVFYISLREFRFEQPAHRQTIEAIRAAINAGRRDFIVDLHCNGGGDSSVGWEILEAMGVTLPTHGIYRRICPLSREQRPDHAAIFPEAQDGDIVQQSAPDTSTASNPNNVTVAVLTNNMTYSSATMMADWIQDGDLGIIIGEPSSNAPSSFGDMLTFTLPNTRLNVRVSYSLFTRSDIYADQSTVWPDIPIDHHEALDAALEFFRNR